MPLHNFNPLDYLKTYYTTMDEENKSLMHWWFSMPIKREDRVIEIGCGPTLFTAIPIIDHCSDYTLADELQENLDEIQRWKDCNPIAFKWGNTIQYYTEHVSWDFSGHDKVIAKKLIENTQLLKLDIHDREQLAPLAEHYDVLIAPFCLAEASSCPETFHDTFDHLHRLVRPGGIFAMVTGIRGCFYNVGDYKLPMCYLVKDDVYHAYTLGFEEVYAKYIPICEPRGYDEIMAIWGRKPK